MGTGECGVVVVTASESQSAGSNFLKHIRENEHAVEVIVVSDREDVSSAVRMMKSGAYDVLVQPLDAGRLLKSIHGALQQWEEERSRKIDEERNRKLSSLDTLVGTSRPMQLVQQTINSVAPSDANVFICGESGTGKELVARALHAGSKRAGRPFVAINCAALPKDILENELFGHEKGAFTGAINQKPGCFELANGGTIFLDEIGEMTTETQAKLLRVIEAQSYRRLGGRYEIKVDVRVVAATNRPVASALEDGALRSDLYYRLSVVEIELPPLRDRRDDILLLAQHFLNVFTFKYGKPIRGFSEDYMEMFKSYSWPGNVRELRNAIERAVVICPGDVIATHDLPGKILKTQHEIMHISIPIGSSVEEAEKKLILETLASVGNNKAKASRILGVSRKTLHNKLNNFKWGVE
ncbi:MAG: sigma-54-dependent transcriptional regulator [Bacteroidota bacterium]